MDIDESDPAAPSGRNPRTSTGFALSSLAWVVESPVDRATRPLRFAGALGVP